jgi:hypothetical protein
MIKDSTLDEALVEVLRLKRALEALRAKRKRNFGEGLVRGCKFYGVETKEHAAAKRASLDLTRKLADLRAGR